MKRDEHDGPTAKKRSKRVLPRARAIKSTVEYEKSLGGGRFKPPPAALYSKVVCG